MPHPPTRALALTLFNAGGGTRCLLVWCVAVALAGCAIRQTPDGPQVPVPPVAQPPAAVAPGPAPVPRAPSAPKPPSAAEPASAARPDLLRDPAEPAPDTTAESDALTVLEQGLASWYGKRFHGRRTASGERFDMNEMTAAHKTLPFGTRLRVRSLRTGREVVVRINDRGPFAKGRVIDLSAAAALALGMHKRGVGRVQLLPE